MRAYLDQTVVPLLLQALPLSRFFLDIISCHLSLPLRCGVRVQGMSELVKVRPENPVEWLAKYLLNNNPKKQGK